MRRLDRSEAQTELTHQEEHHTGQDGGELPRFLHSVRNWDDLEEDMREDDPMGKPTTYQTDTLKGEHSSSVMDASMSLTWFAR